MDVFVDTNILIADPWLQSRRLEGLRDYVSKTRGRIVLLEAVETEFRGHVARSVKSSIETVLTSSTKASRQGVLGLPTIDPDTVFDATMTEWEKRFADFFRAPVTLRVPADGSIVSDLLRRCAHRLPPVNSSGNETRDAIVWLSLLAFLQKRRHDRPAVLISANTRDFAEPESKRLHAALASDTLSINCVVEYFASLESFLSQHAAPVEHISIGWVRDRIDIDAVQDKVAAALGKADPRHFLWPSDINYRDFYEPLRMSGPPHLSIDLDDVYVYELDKGSVNVFLDFWARGEVDIDCSLSRPPQYADWDSYYSDEFKPYRTITAEIGLYVSLDAVVEGDGVRLGQVEEIRRL